MAIKSKVPSDGLVVSYCTTSGGSYTAFANIVDVGEVGSETPEIDTSALGDSVDSSIAGKSKYLEVPVKIHYLPGIFNTMKGYSDAGTIIFIKITPADADTPSVLGPITVWIKKLTFGGFSRNKLVEQTVAFMPAASTAPTFTSGS